ncbi:MAG: DUF4339 domain-containing protein [Akkermansia sp.]|nr:DUF4339 domain-containing protein [Akkermansia sp.]
MSYYYSIDSGKSWEGPFSQEEINNFRAMGIIDEQTLIQEDRQDPQPTVTEAPPSPGGYTVLVNGVPQGPYDLNQLRQLIQSGTIRPNDLVWQQGMEQWLPLSQIVSIESMSGALPSLAGFSIKHFFSEVFKHHSEDELHDCFIAGTRQGTPPLSSVSTTFPTPWIFARLMLFCLILFFGFHWAAAHFQNSILIPGLMFVGNFGIPFCCFLLFFELNIRRNVSLVAGLKALVGGGLLSLIVALFFFDFFQSEGAIWAGPIEEPAKLLAAIFIAGKLRNGQILTGLIMGSAVGAGFAAFESAGYTFNTLMGLLVSSMKGNIAAAMGDSYAAESFFRAASMFDPEGTMHMRALMAPFCHVIWTAVTAGAYWHVMGLKIAENTRSKDDTSIDFSILCDIRFLRLAVIPVGLHMAWNHGIVWQHLGIYTGAVALGLVAWVVALRLVKQGCNQIHQEQTTLN